MSLLGDLRLCHDPLDLRESQYRPFARGEALAGELGDHRTLGESTLTGLADRGEQGLLGVVSHQRLAIDRQPGAVRDLTDTLSLGLLVGQSLRSALTDG